MGYKMPIVCKEVNFPISKGDELTLEEYKEKYGIDLKNYIELDSDNGLILINFPENMKANVVFRGFDKKIPPVVPFVNPWLGYYVEGDSPAFIAIRNMDANNYYIVNFVIRIPYQKALSLENVMVRATIGQIEP